MQLSPLALRLVELFQEQGIPHDIDSDGWATGNHDHPASTLRASIGTLLLSRSTQTLTPGPKMLICGGWWACLVGKSMLTKMGNGVYVREYVYIQESRTAGQLESQHGQNQWIKPGKHSGQWKKLAAAPGTPVTDIETRQLKAMMNMEHKQLQEAAAEVNATVLAQNPDSMALSLRFFCL